MIRLVLAIFLCAACAIPPSGCGPGITFKDLGADLEHPADQNPSTEAGIPEGCKGLSVIPTSIHGSVAGGWNLALAAPALYNQVTIKSPGEKEASAALDWADDYGNIAGFIISKKFTGKDVSQQSKDLAALVLNNGYFQETAILHPGRLTFSREGNPMVSGTLIRFRKSKTEYLYKVRNNLFPMLLAKVGLYSFGKMPGDVSDTRSEEFIMVTSTVLRPSPDQRVIHFGGVMTYNDYDNSTYNRARIRALDLVNSTALGLPGSQTKAACDTLSPALSRPLDVVWVVDGSISMEKVRTELVQKDVIKAAWDEAEKLGLDIRMAVLGMGRSKSAKAGMALCNPNTTQPGQPGQFWSPADDRVGFNACILDPSGNLSREQYSGSWGLKNAREIMRTLLPRIDGDTRKLRKNSRLALIFVSNAEADSVKQDLFGGSIPPWPLTDPQQQADFAAHIAPYISMFTGQQHKDNKSYYPSGSSPADLKETMVHALVQDPKQGCGTKARGTGYMELAQGVGGGVEMICHPQEGMQHLMVEMMRRIRHGLGPLPLSRVPVSGSLAVAPQTTGADPLERSLNKGFDFYGAGNAILLYGEAVQPGQDKLRVSYLYWK